MCFHVGFFGLFLFYWLICFSRVFLVGCLVVGVFTFGGLAVYNRLVKFVLLGLHYKYGFSFVLSLFPSCVLCVYVQGCFCCDSAS